MKGDLIEFVPLVPTDILGAIQRDRTSPLPPRSRFWNPAALVSLSASLRFAAGRGGNRLASRTCTVGSYQPILEGEGLWRSLIGEQPDGAVSLDEAVPRSTCPLHFATIRQRLCARQ